MQGSEHANLLASRPQIGTLTKNKDVKCLLLEDTRADESFVKNTSVLNDV